MRLNSTDRDGEVSLELDHIEHYRLRSHEVSGTTAGLGYHQGAYVYTKMEVLRARQVDRIFLASMTTCGLSLLYTLVMCVLANTKWMTKRQIHHSGETLEVHGLIYERSIGYFDVCTGTIAAVFIFVLAIVFTVRVVKNENSSFAGEQVWVMAILWSSALYMLPHIFARIMFVHDFYEKRFEFKEGTDAWRNAWSVKEWGKMTMRIVWNGRLFGSSITSIFYLWAMSHAYGLKNRLRTNLNRLKFYAPKVIPLILYFVLRCYVSFAYDVLLSQLPFTSLGGMLKLFSIVHRWPRNIIVFTCILTLFEIYFIANIIRCALRTAEVLRGQDYITTRAKQVGFRFLLAHNFIYYAVMIAIDMLVRIFFPLDIAAASLLKEQTVYFSNGIGVVVIDVMSVVNALIIAYVNLPPDSVGFRGWFGVRNDEDDDELYEREPLSLVLREKSQFLIRKSQSGTAWNRTLIIRDYANCCVLPSIITLFNFAWLVYEWERYKDWGNAHTVDVNTFAITDFIDNEFTDTHLMVVSAQDRIILAFKGTSSVQNVRTDLKMVTRPLLSKFPTSESVREELSKKLEWRVARVHLGFIDAYASVSSLILDKVKRLLREAGRPILLTGHSLGGSLATLCSLDLRLSLGLSEHEISVATFGMPRIGNAAWSHLYNKHVHSHWRFVLKSDIIPNFPLFPYRHVGKQVLLSSTGNLFLDPNGLETMLWGGEMSSMIYHRKPAYLLALKAFCLKYLREDFKPAFWDWDINAEVLELWEQKTGISLCSDGPGEIPRLFVGFYRREPSLLLESSGA